MKLNSLYPRKTKNQIFLLIIGLGATTMLINLVITFSFQRKFIEENLEQLLSSQHAIVHEILAEAFLFQNIFTIHEVIEAIADKSSLILNVYILDKDKIYLTDALVLHKFPYLPAISSATTVISPKSGIRLFYKPIQVNDVLLGYQVFEIDTDKINAQIYLKVVRLLMLQCLVLMMGVVIGGKIIFFLTKPLETLTEKVKETDFETFPMEIWLPRYAPLEVHQLRDNLFEMSVRLMDSTEKIREKEQQLAHHENLAAIGRMSAQVAHELKSPIMTIKLLSHKINAECGNCRFEPDMPVIEKEADRLAIRVNDLLGFSKPMELQFTEQRLLFLLEEVMIDADQRYGSALTVNVKTENDVIFLTDKEKLLRIFSNLVDNAVEAGARKLEITTKIEKKSMIFDITDNGIGLEQGIAKKIFMPFFTTKSKGTGLGLSITQMLVQAMNGTIWTDEEYPQGARFLLEFKHEKNFDYR
ncbi:HAMP domain-containing sensor histidine kinase [Deltaproteobacteria bacterium TL4]